MKKLEATLSLSKLLSPTYNDLKELKQIMQSDSSAWEEIIKVANRYILVPALYATLKRKELLVWVTDIQLLEYMEEIYSLNTKRNKAILIQTEEICKLLATIGVKPVLLKGSAALSEMHYHTIGERAMMDIDILVPEDKLFECVALLKSSDGYKEINNDTKLSTRWHHYYRLYKDSGMTSVEIHRYPLRYEEIKSFPKELTGKYVKQSQSIKNASVIEPMYELYHSFLHSQISHKYHSYDFLALRHLHHFTVMADLYKDVNWSELSALVEAKNLKKTWEEYLFVLQDFFKLEVPVEIQESKSKQKYLQKVYKRINLVGSKQLFVKAFMTKLFNAFGYDSLSSRYNFKCKALLLLYIPVRVISLIYQYLADSKQFGTLLSDLKITSN